MDQLTALQLIIYALANFGAAILSGIAGGGGGFINVPLLIFLGLSPAQAVATGKIPGLAVSLGSLGGLKGTQPKSKKQLVAIMAVALIIGLIAPLFITRLGSDIYRYILAGLLLAMIPVLIYKKIGLAGQNPSPSKQGLGYGLLILALGLQGIFGAGLGTLVNVVFMTFLGMTALEANLAKRYSQVILNSVIVLGVLLTGLIVWQVALVGIFSAGLGGYIGGKLAVKRGNSFVIGVFIILMLVSAIGLLLGW